MKNSKPFKKNSQKDRNLNCHYTTDKLTITNIGPKRKKERNTPPHSIKKKPNICNYFV